jgi:hypothetical protein
VIGAVRELKRAVQLIHNTYCHETKTNTITSTETPDVFAVVFVKKTHETKKFYHVNGKVVTVSIFDSAMERMNNAEKAARIREWEARNK